MWSHRGLQPSQASIGIPPFKALGVQYCLGSEVDSILCPFPDWHGGDSPHCAENMGE